MTTFKGLRKRAKQPAKEIAAQLGISESTYRKYECYSRLPRLETIIKMIAAYQCTGNELLEALKIHEIIYGNRKKLKARGRN